MHSGVLVSPTLNKDIISQSNYIYIYIYLSVFLAPELSRKLFLLSPFESVKQAKHKERAPRVNNK